MKFFNPEALISKQSVRWNYAVGEYDRILTANALRRYASMTPSQRNLYLDSMSMLREDAGKSLAEQFIAIEKRRKNPPGHPKSALFARLLNGIPALAIEPPTSYSDPWYEVIEQEGPFAVNVTQAFATAQDFHYPHLSGGPGLLLNHCPWRIVSMNAPAQRLMKLQERIKLVGKSMIDTMKFWKLDTVITPPSYDWSGRLLQDVEKEIAAGCELVVRHGENKPFFLRCERTSLLHTRRQAQRIIQGGDRAEKLRGISCVFDTNSLFLLPEIGAVITPSFSSGPHDKDNDMVQLNYHGWFLRANT